MADIVGVRFEPAGRVYFFDPSGLELAIGERVIVETEEGAREGQIVITPRQVLYSDLRGPMGPVLRKAGDSQR